MTTQQLQILSDLLIDSTAIVNENEVLLVDNEFNESVSSIKNALTTLFLDALNKKADNKTTYSHLILIVNKITNMCDSYERYVNLEQKTVGTMMYVVMNSLLDVASEAMMEFFRNIELV